jgi:hypothetical protein
MLELFFGEALRTTSQREGHQNVDRVEAPRRLA